MNKISNFSMKIRNAMYIIVLLLQHSILFWLIFQTDADPCSPNPCKHDSSCFNIQGDFYCHCQENWEGKDCSHPRPLCGYKSCDGKKWMFAHIKSLSIVHRIKSLSMSLNNSDTLYGLPYLPVIVKKISYCLQISLNTICEVSVFKFFGMTCIQSLIVMIFITIPITFFRVIHWYHDWL